MKVKILCHLFKKKHNTPRTCELKVWQLFFMLSSLCRLGSNERNIKKIKKRPTAKNGNWTRIWWIRVQTHKRGNSFSDDMWLIIDLNALDKWNWSFRNYIRSWVVTKMRLVFGHCSRFFSNRIGSWLINERYVSVSGRMFYKKINYKKNQTILLSLCQISQGVCGGRHRNSKIGIN